MKEYNGFSLCLQDEEGLHSHTIIDVPLTKVDILKRITEFLDREEKEDAPTD